MMRVIFCFLCFIAIGFSIAFLFVMNREYFAAKNNNNPETVVVLHGIGKTNRITYFLARRIANAGFEVYNIAYPSTEYSINDLVDILNRKLIGLKLDKKEKINFVGHSMGGLLIRGYLNKYKPKNLHRVVMIGTPNHGSELVRYFNDWWIFKKKFGIAGEQLGVDQKGLSSVFGIVDYDLGIIAGKTYINPIFSNMIPGDDDGLVSIESTKLDGMKAHMVLNFSHTMGLFYREVANNTIFYLKNGKFD